VTPVEFRGDLWLKKTRVPGLSCGVVYVILCLAVLVELRLVTDRQTNTDRQTQAHGLYRGCIASRGNNIDYNKGFTQAELNRTELQTAANQLRDADACDQ